MVNSIQNRRQNGFSLIEVMIAIVVLSFGLLALAALQAGLFRAGAEAKARANATAVAQQVVEDAKTFAYLSPPGGYTGATYQSLDTAASSTTVGGVPYTVCRRVVRYIYDSATTRFVPFNTVSTTACSGSAAGAVNAGVPEFKEVRVAVTWSGDAGQTKSVELTDAVSAIAPSDAAQVLRGPLATARGPEVWIVPPNKDNPQVVPIAIGGDQSAASSNPKPQQFIQDVSAATLFSVQIFTGSTTGDEVRLNRKLDVAAVSCVCASDSSSVSTASNPTYQPTIWNGKQLAYLEPDTLPVGAKIATPVLSSSSSEIESMCTVCCRDHHEAAGRQPHPDPYRALTTAEANGAEHYGYKLQSANTYRVGDGLFPQGTDTEGRYVDACQLIRVNGRMRLAVDTQQNYLLETPLDDVKTGYRVPDFINKYSAFVSGAVADGMASLPAGYPSPTPKFPAPTAARLSAASDVVTPATIDLGTAGDTKKLVSFGLYIDYLSQDTIDAYNCAVGTDNTGNCAGLADRNPLGTLPFYAVNVANLGSWSSAKAAVGSVANTIYDNRGLLATDGGMVTAQSGASAEAFLVTLEINNSNSGLAGTLPVDPDDKVNFVADSQNFTKTNGVVVGLRWSLFVKVSSSSTLTLSTVLVESPAGGTPCTYTNKSGLTTCRFDAPAPSLTVSFENYSTNSKVKGVTVFTDRKICVPADPPRVSGPTVTGNGTTADKSVVTLNLGETDYTLTIDIVNEIDACPTGTRSLSP